MGWRLTGRYVFSLVLLVIVVLFINGALLFMLLINQNTDPEMADQDHSMEGFTRSFSEQMSINEDGLSVTQAGIRKLEQRGAWLQILDETGSEVMAVRKPNHVIDDYSPMELIHNYKYMDDELHTYFIGEYQSYSYIIGVPETNERRIVMMINAQSILDFTSRTLLIMLGVNLLIAIGFGFLFSKGITKPMHQLTEAIRRIKHQDYIGDDEQTSKLLTPVFATLQDVSQTYERFEKERKKMETMRAEWISNVSHDLKTPLASVQGYTELLKSHDLSSNEAQYYIKVIERQSLYMKELIEDFQLTTRLRFQELPMSFEPVRIESFMRECVIQVLNEPRFENANLTFQSEEAEIIWDIDRHLYFRAVMNLLRNALVHNDDDVEIIVSVSSGLIKIADKGKGIAPDKQKFIFERYYKGTNTEDSEGSGLGMAIARDIIHAHGDTIHLESKQGKGTTIKISRN